MKTMMARFEGRVRGLDGQREPPVEVLERAHPRRFSATYKLKVLKQYEALEREGKGALLRREGLYTSRISEWRKQRDQGVLAAFAPKLGRPEADPRDRELARLCRELAHAELELDKARKVVEIQSKLSALF